MIDQYKEMIDKKLKKNTKKKIKKNTKKYKKIQKKYEKMIDQSGDSVFRATRSIISIRSESLFSILKWIRNRIKKLYNYFLLFFCLYDT